MSGVAHRILYSNDELRALAMSPAALEKPPDLLRAVDRSSHNGTVAIPSRLSRTNKQKSIPQVAPAPPMPPKWKPKPLEQKPNAQTEFRSRHWEADSVGSEDAEDMDTPAWANDSVDFTENFDFSQATLERDREKLVEPAAQSSSHSRFSFVESGAHSHSDEGSNVRQQSSRLLVPDVSNPPSAAVLSSASKSRFNFVNEPEKPNAPVGQHFLTKTTSSQSSLHQKRPSARASENTRPSSSQVPPRTPQMPLSLPKGTVIEVEQMFQMFAMANPNNQPTHVPHPPLPTMPSPYFPGRTGNSSDLLRLPRGGDPQNHFNNEDNIAHARVSASRKNNAERPVSHSSGSSQSSIPAGLRSQSGSPLNQTSINVHLTRTQSSAPPGIVIRGSPDSELRFDTPSEQSKRLQGRTSPNVQGQSQLSNSASANSIDQLTRSQGRSSPQQRNLQGHSPSNQVIIKSLAEHTEVSVLPPTINGKLSQSIAASLQQKSRVMDPYRQAPVPVRVQTDDIHARTHVPRSPAGLHQAPLSRIDSRPPSGIQSISPSKPAAARLASDDPSGNPKSIPSANPRNRPKPIVPAGSAPPAYVRSYMNMQTTEHAPLVPYAPPGMSGPPFFSTAHYPPPARYPPPHSPFR
uniref:Uncharacterized protein n=1 Tax=Spongospora subterranea TaxID=70186 RepID=A0A0H5RL83_9EUKA|eukprot:CRZ09479.1 hypothetical protein [Spongospora subterranea]